uniref:RING-type domain-containing protein n=1 Tax=Caenorhabditis japonica TaxID=281687 RepID=A0A8R1IN19_CAEJA
MSNEKQCLLWKFAFILYFCIHNCQAQYVLDVIKMASFGEKELVHKCAATGGNFGKDVSDFILSEENLGCAVQVQPVDACEPITVAHNHTPSCYNLFAMVSRSSKAHPCNFSHQAYMVQYSPYPFRLAIFYNYPEQDPISMNGADMSDQVTIPVIMITNDCKEEILRKFTGANVRLQIRIDPEYYELFRYLIPFLVVIVFCFALFLITLCVRGCFERRKLNKRRLSKRNLKKIPVKKYRMGDDPDTCAICLESFSHGEKLRHLPCRHVFHCKCIDVWLTQTRKVCPLCKRKIRSDSDSECSLNDSGESSQIQNEDRRLFPSSLDHMLEESPATTDMSRLGDMWSSQEALVDHDIVLVESTRQSVTSFFRNTLRKLRKSGRNVDAENGSGLESNSHSSGQQAQSIEDDILLEQELFVKYPEPYIFFKTSEFSDLLSRVKTILHLQQPQKLLTLYNWTNLRSGIFYALNNIENEERDFSELCATMSCGQSVIGVAAIDNKKQSESRLSLP